MFFFSLFFKKKSSIYFYLSDGNFLLTALMLCLVTKQNCKPSAAQTLMFAIWSIVSDLFRQSSNECELPKYNQNNYCCSLNYYCLKSFSFLVPPPTLNLMYLFQELPPFVGRRGNNASRVDSIVLLVETQFLTSRFENLNCGKAFHTSNLLQSAY